MNCQIHHKETRRPRFKIEVTPVRGDKFFKLFADAASALKNYALYVKMGYQVLLMPA
jgi:hypothetical protein